MGKLPSDLVLAPDGFFGAETPINDTTLNVLAHLPTRHLNGLVGHDFYSRLTDVHLMRLGVLLAQKSFREGGCPIGAVIVDRVTREIVGKGHNTLVQENHPYNHGETAAIRDAGRIDFSRCILLTTLSPCDICARLIIMRQFPHVIVGDVTNAEGNEQLLRDHGIQVDVLEDSAGIALYQHYQHENPDLEREDWMGVGARHPQ